ncbi:beta-N-acetylhexosaminidase [Polaribacter sp. P097]|uniref:beta-N-acetylhexosaminidase n=1 Tax=Polaribacter sp. P097 TaxID=3117398 RepID=UPI002FE0547A
MKKFIIILLIVQCSNLFVQAQDVLSNKYDLMPWPKEITEYSDQFTIDQNLTIAINSKKSERVDKAAVRFLRRLAHRTGVFLDKGFPVYNQKGNINLIYDTASALNLNTDESYVLEISKSKIDITAKSDVGILRGLETLLQLTQFNKKTYYFPNVTINDAPRFVWRGLMIDVSRHFQPIAVIKRNLEAMASVKMNVFHWHLTDDQGFRIESKVYPKLQEFASDGLFYTQNQIKDVVAFANNLGIRVIPEIDVPGHASAILTAYPELGSKDNYTYSIERFAGVFDPTLDPSKEITYTFLENLFTEITPLFPDEYFHIGGDENEGKHWSENEEIKKFKEKHQLKNNHELQTHFNIRLEKILNKLGKKLMGWDEILTPNMPTTAVIHSWRGENEGVANGGSLIEAAKKGYQTVLSNGFYIDRMLSVEHHYAVDPIGDIKLSKEELSKILGGEATMWSELVTPQTIDSRIWPRTAAIAERLWSTKDVKDIHNMKKRLSVISYQLEELGLTHIKNRDVILRSISHNQDISSLEDLVKICEPLKIYARNKDGIEYKTYSSFSLFADACTADALDANIFNKKVTNFLKVQNRLNTANILSFLEKWAKNYDTFSKLEKNPKMSVLEDLSKNLSTASTILKEAIESKKINNDSLLVLKEAIAYLKLPVADTEVVIVTALEQLEKHCKANYKK